MKLIRTSNSNPAHMNSLMSDFFNDSFLNWPGSSWNQRSLPPANIRETEDHWSIDLAVPGMKKEDFEIELDDDVLNISASVENKQEEDDKNFSMREFSAMSFKRVFRLPENKVKGDKIEARYENGVLSLLLPKREEAKPQPVKRIAIS